MGRFAPSPSGDLHLGSLYAAAASFLDARAAGGQWLVRMEDLDTPRTVPGSAERILHTLEAFGFEWDGAVLYQSTRGEAYRSALDDLRRRDQVFECSCSRTALADEDRYPGTCRLGAAPKAVATATRLKTQPGVIQFADLIQGVFRQDVAKVVGDFIIRRRDDIVAYVLAVVIDDAAQRVSHVVRGADLLDNTPRQIYLQRLLDLATPHYAHVAVLVEADGRKLAKSARSVAVDPGRATAQLVTVFSMLGLAAPADACHASLATLWRWAVAAWDRSALPRRLTHPMSA